MAPGKTEKSSTSKLAQKSRDRADEVANIFEWLITAFILAFVFRAFIMEAFRIPTGSMADTLEGAHFRLRCPQCGYEYDHGFIPGHYYNQSGRRLAEDTVPAGTVPLPSTRCPSCGNYTPDGRAASVANGDRILVLKCIYQFLEPKRWDVVVFKNPPEPTINYIKRLIALPNEEVQIIDGDIYINGLISRKPPKVQQEQWMVVYNNDYQPVNPFNPTFNGHQWEQPFRPEGSSKWEADKLSPTQFHLDSPIDQINTMKYDTSIGNDFRATYAYDDVRSYKNLPYCSDLMVRFNCFSTEPEGCIGISLSKYETTYRAQIILSPGTITITKQKKGQQPVELVAVPIKKPRPNMQTLIKFANVDHQLILEFNGSKWKYDMGRYPQDVGPITEDIEPEVEIFGSGKLMLSHVAIFRDIYYTSLMYANSTEFGRATHTPFVLGKDEFFVLGDNSPNSEDCRWWTEPGKANKGLPPYRVGIVPRNYLVGKALFVYWPSGFKPFSGFPFGIIPNIGMLRFIYGGSNHNN
jgi:signal peptidase I